MAITRVKVTERVAAPAEKVWDYLGAFNGLPKIMKGLVLKSEISQVSNVRRIQIAGVRKQLNERLLKLDNAKMTMTYEIVEEPNTPVPMYNYTSTIKVMATSSRACNVEWSSSFEPKKGSTKEECVGFATSVYAAGIEGTRKVLGLGAKKTKKKASPKAKAVTKKKASPKAKATTKKKSNTKKKS